MSHETFDNEDELRRTVRDELDAGPLPAGAQARLNNVYASLGSIPQDRPAAPGAPAPRPMCGTCGCSPTRCGCW